MLYQLLGAIRAWCQSRRHRDRLGCWRASYRIHTVYNTHCIQYTLYTLHTVYNTHCIQYTLYTIHTVYSTHCIQYTLYTIHTVYNTHCIQYTLYTIHTVYNTHCETCKNFRLQGPMSQGLCSQSEWCDMWNCLCYLNLYILSLFFTCVFILLFIYVLDEHV
jgi:hypothetical protein